MVIIFHITLFLWANKRWRIINYDHFANPHLFCLKVDITKLQQMKGTSFQLKVWKYLKKIPRGSVKTYIQVAKGIGKPLAVRAVANAIGKNPYAPRIPCHRVIRSDGSLGGYSGKGGIKTKKLLLKKEGITL